MKKIAIAGALALASTSGWAAESTGFYLGANFGKAEYDVAQSDLDAVAISAFESTGATVLGGESTLDEKGSAWSLSAGYRFSRYVAAEVAYVDLGEARYRSQATIFLPGLGIADAAVDLDLSSKGPAVALVGLVPVGSSFDLHGRAGMLFAKTTMDIGASVNDSTASDAVSANSRDFFFSAGAAFHFSENFAATLDYNRLQDVGDEEETGERSVDSMTLGLVYKL